MRTAAKDILIRFKNRWQLLRWMEIFLYAIGPAVLIYFLFLNLILTLVVFMLIASVCTLILRPWTLKLEDVSSYIDLKLSSMEYSTGLLLLPQESLSGLAQLQQQKVSAELKEKSGSIKPENNLFKAGLISSGLILIGFIMYQFNLTNHYKTSQTSAEEQEIILFEPTDAASAETDPPVLDSQQVIISYPNYTGVSSYSTSKMELQAVEGSRATWKLKFSAKVDSVTMESMGNSHPMKPVQDSYSGTSVLNTSGFYNFKFMDTLGNSYVSKLYSIEVIADKSPVIGVDGLKQFSSFNFDDEKRVEFSALITDDFGVADAFIIATVSKGTGEAVKFREEKLSFEEPVKRGAKSVKLSKKIDLDQMNMEPGDELYFYIEARDLKQPVANISRSETYFMVIKDTVSYASVMESSLGVELMPDYFRSQRQLIIDTEKLISQRNKLPKPKFNSTSNDLGFDQKALRLKYGQFMGDESEGGMEAHVDEGNEEEQDPLAEFTHDHDGDNEHNLVEPEHDHEKEDEEDVKDPLSEFLHDHGDPESATLFTDNLRSKLRQALNIMWDAELYLRLYEPEKSLPYQYQALGLIQEIKNSARIYVHRIGFDPPPIKEEVRLTGKIDEVTNFQKKEDLKKPESYPFIRKAVIRLEQLIADELPVNSEDRKLFEQAGNELAEKAIEEPGKYLQTLQNLKWLSEKDQNEPKMFVKVQRGLLLAIPTTEPTPGKRRAFSGDINELLLKELELNDR
ncbi:tryptophan-rich sensory protein [Gillisia sp. Q332]|uniref:tryptophan-rich sensory protein n=1 Tax=Gillisia xinjiangensis TaxID=3384765 RepID=UPI00391D2061